VEFALEHKKPCLHLCAGDEVAAEQLRVFVEKHGVKVLNVAGRGPVKSLGWGSL